MVAGDIGENFAAIGHKFRAVERGGVVYLLENNHSEAAGKERGKAFCWHFERDGSGDFADQRDDHFFDAVVDYVIIQRVIAANEREQSLSAVDALDGDFLDERKTELDRVFAEQTFGVCGGDSGVNILPDILDTVVEKVVLVCVVLVKSDLVQHGFVAYFDNGDFFKRRGFQKFHKRGAQIAFASSDSRVLFFGHNGVFRHIVLRNFR